MKHIILLFISSSIFFFHCDAQDKVIGEKGSTGIIGEKGGKEVIGEKSKPLNFANLKKIRTELQQLLAQYQRQVNEAEGTAKLLRKKFDEGAKELKTNADNNNQVQELMLAYNAAEAYSSSVQKRLDETRIVIIKLDKIIGEKGGKD